MPVLVDGVVAGGVGVSGLSDEEDEALAARAGRIAARQPAASVSA